MNDKLLLIAVALMSLQLLNPRTANAQDPTVTTKVGGHLGLALPLLTIGSDLTVIGDDFVNVGVTPGITVKLNDRWAVDFEFIAFNAWKGGTTAATFVVDPGVVYAFDSVVAGLRVATEIGAARNIGLVPIIVKPFEIREGLSYFLELDLPLFLRDDGEDMKPSLTVLLQSGFAF